MSFAQYWSMLCRHWYLVLLCTLAMALGALLVSLLLAPVYQSTALMQVAIHTGDNQSDINDLLASNQLVQTEAALATSDPVLRDVASRHAPLSVEQLSQMVTTSARLNTQLFEITVQDTSATRAAQLANDIATTLMQHQEEARRSANQSSQDQLQQELNRTHTQIVTLKARIAAIQAQNTNSTQQAQISSLMGQLNTLQQHYDQWNNALTQQELSEAQSGDFLRVTQSAQPAPAPLRPNVPLYTLGGGITGMLLGFFLVMIWSKLDKRIRTPEEVNQLVDWPILAMLWRADPVEGTAGEVGPVGSMKSVPIGPNEEAYNLLRSHIGFAAVDKPLRSLLVTSTRALDGKSTVAAHLARCMASTGKSTLLIDANLRCPALHELFGLSPDAPGLSNAILACGALPSPPSARSSTQSVLLDPFMQSVDVANLRVMTSGPLPPNSSELLDSKAMQRFFLALMQCNIDSIIFDAPPVVDLSDACTLAAMMDGTLFVVNMMNTQKAALAQASSLLLQANARVVGCVLNKRPGYRPATPYAMYTYGSDAALRK